jgi:hypothetical protein
VRQAISQGCLRDITLGISNGRGTPQ